MIGSHANERQGHILKYKCTKVEQKRKRERKEERKIEGTKRRIKNKAETIRKIRQVLEENRNRNALRKENKERKRGKTNRIITESAK